MHPTALAVIQTSEEILHAELEFRRLLGCGRAGDVRVYEAVKRRDGVATVALPKPQQRCAVKVLPKARVTRSAVDRIVSTWSRIDALNVTKLFAAYETERAWYFLAELLTGGDLLERLKGFRTTFSESTAHMLFRQIARAVAAAHGCGVVLRDLRLAAATLSSPAEWAVLKVTDFHAACLASDAAELAVPCGARGFRSPEAIRVARGQKQSLVSQASDVFALGVVLHFLLSGTLPFDVSSDDRYDAAALAGVIDFAGPAWQAVSGDAKDLVMCMLQVDPARRISAEMALKHPWATSREINRRPLALAQRNFARLVAQRKARALLHAVRFAAVLIRGVHVRKAVKATAEAVAAFGFGDDGGAEEMPGTSSSHQHMKHQRHHSGRRSSSSSHSSSKHSSHGAEPHAGVLGLSPPTSSSVVASLISPRTPPVLPASISKHDHGRHLHAHRKSDTFALGTQTPPTVALTEVPEGTRPHHHHQKKPRSAKVADAETDFTQQRRQSLPTWTNPPGGEEESAQPIQRHHSHHHHHH